MPAASGEASRYGIRPVASWVAREWAWVLREGVFCRTRLLGGEPLLLDVRAASVRDLVVVHGACLPNAEQVARLGLQNARLASPTRVVAPAADEREAPAASGDAARPRAWRSATTATRAIPAT
jgi:hypothetical protein